MSYCICFAICKNLMSMAHYFFELLLKQHTFDVRYIIIQTSNQKTEEIIYGK